MRSFFTSLALTAALSQIAKGKFCLVTPKNYWCIYAILKISKITSKVCIPRFSGERLRREGDTSSPQVLLSKCPRSLRFLNESVCKNIINGVPLKAVWEETSVTSADL